MKPTDQQEYEAEFLMSMLAVHSDHPEVINSVHSLIQARDRVFHEQCVVFLFDKHGTSLPELSIFNAMQTFPGAGRYSIECNELSFIETFQCDNIELLRGEP